MDLSGAAAPTRAPGPLPPTGTGTGQPPLTVQAPAQAEPDTQAQQEGSQQQLADTAASESKANAASTARGGGVAGWFDQDLRQRMVQVQKEGETSPKWTYGSKRLFRLFVLYSRIQSSHVLSTHVCSPAW